MPLAFSVSCPGKLGDQQPAIERLKEDLSHRERCIVETVGWVHGFVVRLQESSRTNVMALLTAADCSVIRETVQQYEWPISEHYQQPTLQHCEPWNIPVPAMDQLHDHSPESQISQHEDAFTIPAPVDYWPVSIPLPSVA